MTSENLAIVARHSTGSASSSRKPFSERRKVAGELEIRFNRLLVRTKTGLTENVARVRCHRHGIFTIRPPISRPLRLER